MTAVHGLGCHHVCNNDPAESMALTLVLTSQRHCLGEEAFSAALHATAPHSAHGGSTWDRELAAAAHSLLAEWKDEVET